MRFYSCCLYQVTISLVISVAVINLSGRLHCRPLPRSLTAILNGRTGKYLGLADHIYRVIIFLEIFDGKKVIESSLNDNFCIYSLKYRRLIKERTVEKFIHHILNDLSGYWHQLPSTEFRSSFFVMYSCF